MHQQNNDKEIRRNATRELQMLSRAQHQVLALILEAAALHGVHARKCKKPFGECSICKLADAFYKSLNPLDAARVSEQPQAVFRFPMFNIMLENGRDRFVHSTKRATADFHAASRLFAGFKDRHPKEFGQLTRRAQ